MSRLRGEQKIIIIIIVGDFIYTHFASFSSPNFSQQHFIVFEFFSSLSRLLCRSHSIHLLHKLLKIPTVRVDFFFFVNSSRTLTAGKFQIDLDLRISECFLLSYVA